MRKKLHQEQGFSLIEVIVAIVLLAVVLLSFFSFFISGAKFNAINNNNIQATSLARQYTAQFNDQYDYLKSKLAYLQDSPSDADSASDILTKVDTESAQPYEIIYKINVNPEQGNYYRKLRKVHVLVKENGKIITESFTYHEGEN